MKMLNYNILMRMQVNKVLKQNSIQIHKKIINASIYLSKIYYLYII